MDGAYIQLVMAPVIYVGLLLKYPTVEPSN